MNTVSSFAGFTLPRLRGINAEKRAPLARRLADFRRYSAQYGRPIFSPCGPYQCRQFATDAELSFYQDDSATMPGLRYETGRAFAYDDCEPLAAFVFRLPHGRGFLAGWSMGDGMAAMVSRDIIADERDAMARAEDMADAAALRESEYQERWREARDAEDERDAAREALRAARMDARAALRAVRELRATGAPCDAIEQTRVIVSVRFRAARNAARAALRDIRGASATLAALAADGVTP